MIPFPLEKVPEPVMVTAGDTGEAINIMILAVQMGIPVSVVPEPPFATFTHLVYVYAKEDQLIQFNTFLEKIK